MAAPFRNGVFMKNLIPKGLFLKTIEPNKPIPIRCQNVRQYSSLHRPNRLHHAVIRGGGYKKLYTITVIRHASSSNLHDLPPGYIPDVPDVPELESWTERLPDMVELNALGEPTLQSIGLGSYYPAGLVQQGLEAIHVGLDIPWWISITVGVVIIRMFMFPLIIKQRRTLIKYNNIMPKVLKIQAELSEAQAATDYIEAQKAADKMKTLMTDNGIYLRSIFLPILCQIPVFMSVFFGLRKMAEFPVLSMQTGGCLWFENLTVVDPTMMLPVITAATLWLNLELGAESMKAQSPAVQPIARAMMRVMPLFTLVATTQFPAALCVYWASSNVFTLSQAMVLKIPVIRRALGIPIEMQHSPENQPPRKMRIGKRLKDAYRTTSKLTESQNRKTVDMTEFKRSSNELMEEGWKETQEVVRPTKTVTDSKAREDVVKRVEEEVRQKQKL